MTKRLMIKVDEYQKDGQTKGKYVELGVILSGETGEYALINPSVNIAGCLMQQRVMNQGKEKKGKGDMVMCSIFERTQSDSNQGRNDPPPFDDDVGF